MVNSVDVAVVGGGMVGAAIAYGLAWRRLSVVVLDEGDVAFRAARRNFGLVWVQGKGWDMPAYAALTRRSSDAWPGFAHELAEATGVDLEYRRPGGVDICFDDRELAARETKLSGVDRATDGGFPFEMLDQPALVALGCPGPNQLKAFTRCGMGPCQGRLCGPTVSEAMDQLCGVAVDDIGYFRLRSPVKPLTLGELAALADDKA